MNRRYAWRCYLPEPVELSCWNLRHPTRRFRSFWKGAAKGFTTSAFKSKDIRQKIEELQSASLQLISMSSETGLEGRKIAFLHPKSTHGVLIELVECDPEA